MLAAVLVAIVPFVGPAHLPAPLVWYACTTGHYLAIDDVGRTAWSVTPPASPVRLSGATVTGGALISADLTLNRATGAFADIGTGQSGLCWKSGNPPLATPALQRG